MGRAIARRLHEDGYSLSLGARDVDTLLAAHAELDRDRVAFQRYDALDPATADAWIDATTERFGRIDGLVNNAGILRQFSIEDEADEALDEMWAVNVKAPLRLTRLAFPHLKATGTGRIVNLSSLSGLRVKRLDFVGYSMTKYALNALSHATRQSGWDHGIRATAICPGAVDTGMVAPLGFPSGNMLRPETIADLVSMVIALPNIASIAEIPVNVASEPGY
jgi:NAD(P)-dependent dehydrogenase (short-subunit alcohol dehydrogenase family)